MTHPPLEANPTKERSPLWVGALNTVCIGLLLFVFAILALDLATFLRTNGREYPIGAENMGFTYSSRLAYVATSAAMIGEALIGLLVPFLFQNRRRRLAVRCVTTLVFLGWVAWRNYELTMLNG